MKKGFFIVSLIVIGVSASVYYIKELRPIHIAKKAVESDLISPVDVLYKNVRRVGDNTVCGQYNAKNRVGAYVGYRKFYVNVSGPSVSALMEGYDTTLSQVEGIDLLCEIGV